MDCSILSVSMVSVRCTRLCPSPSGRVVGVCGWACHWYSLCVWSLFLVYGLNLVCSCLRRIVSGACGCCCCCCALMVNPVVVGMWFGRVMVVSVSSEFWDSSVVSLDSSVSVLLVMWLSFSSSAS